MVDHPSSRRRSLKRRGFVAAGLSALIPVGDAGAVRVIRGSRNDDEATVPDAGDVQGRSSRLVRPGRQG
ncbi:MAG: hypothetical protein AAGC83_11820, partial [Pseudomonadota bacterium]